MQVRSLPREILESKMNTFTVNLAMHNCLQCAYSRHINDAADIRGKTVCIRYPPQVTSLPIQNGFASFQNVPVVNESSICGEFTSKEFDCRYWDVYRANVREAN